MMTHSPPSHTGDQASQTLRGQIIAVVKQDGELGLSTSERGHLVTMPESGLVMPYWYKNYSHRLDNPKEELSQM
jgi:hypothetical protein